MKFEFISIYIFFSVQIGYSQCPDKSSIYKNIIEFEEYYFKDTSSSKNLNFIKNLYSLNQKWVKCNYTADSTYAKILHLLGRTYWYEQKFELGLKLTKKAIEINTIKRPDSKEADLANSYHNLGRIYLEKGDINLALKSFQNSIDMGKKYHEKYGVVARTYVYVANLYHFAGDYQNSILNAEKGAEFAKKILSNEFIFSNKIEKIQSLILFNKLTEAKKELDNILNLSKKINDVSFEAQILSLYGLLNEKQLHFDNAITFYKKSFESYKILITDFGKGVPYGCSQALTNIGNIYLEKKEYEKAIFYLKKADKYSIDNDMKARILSNIGGVYFLKRDYIGALKIYQNAIEIMLPNFKDSPINTLPNTSLLKLVNTKEYVLDILHYKANSWLELYKISRKKEYLENAMYTFESADRTIDLMRFEHKGELSKFFWRDKTRPVYENAIEVCYLLKNYEKAFYFFEKSRAVLLNDKINNLTANQLLTESDQLKERSFLQKISELNAKLNQESNEAKISELNVKLLDIQENQQSFVKSLAVKYPSYYAFKYDTSIYDLGQLKQYLNNRKLSFIAYFKGDSANYQLVIKPTGVNLLKQKTTEDNLKYLINANDLGKRVLVSQDGEFVPLDTLKNSEGKYLLNKYAFSYTYSAQYLLRNAESKTPSSGKFFNNFIGFAPVNYSKSMALPTLFGAEKALDKVSQNYFWPQIFQNEKATKSNFKRNASDYKIIQLFTHADADNINREPTIFFADSGMKVSELESIGKFKAELLVLSACKTNVGKIIKGEGTLSMAREFAGLGIPASITTLWSVENDATYQITELFYKYLKKGEPKDLALQKAKLEFLDTNSREKQNPKYWSAFVLMGEVNPLIIELNSFYWLVGILALVTVLVIIYFIFRSKPLIIK